MDYRRLVLSDLNSYYENRLRALQKSPTAFLTTFEEEKARGNSHFQKTLSDTSHTNVIFGAVENDVVVGSVGLFQEHRPKINHKAMIWGMYVDEKFRKSGIGSRLIDLAIYHAKNEMKVSALFLSVESSNQKARSLYESKGFTCWGTEPKAMLSDGIYFDEYHMALIF